MAAFIAKIVRSGSNDKTTAYQQQSSGNIKHSYGNGYRGSMKPELASRVSKQQTSFGNDTKIQRSEYDDEIRLTSFCGQGGIVRTVTTMVVAETDGESC